MAQPCHHPYRSVPAKPFWGREPNPSPIFKLGNCPPLPRGNVWWFTNALHPWETTPHLPLARTQPKSRSWRPDHLLSRIFGAISPSLSRWFSSCLPPVYTTCPLDTFPADRLPTMLVHEVSQFPPHPNPSVHQVRSFPVISRPLSSTATAVSDVSHPSRGRRQPHF